jgi:hypothetical protein
VGSAQTLDCSLNDFSVTLLPGVSSDATVDCDVTSSGSWHLDVHAAAAPFFTGFNDVGAVPAAYAPPAATDGQVAVTASGAKSVPAFSAGTLWRGFAGLTDITIGGDTAATGGAETVTNRIRAELGVSSTVASGARTRVVTYTLSPGPP